MEEVDFYEKFIPPVMVPLTASELVMWRRGFPKYVLPGEDADGLPVGSYHPLKKRKIGPYVGRLLIARSRLTLAGVTLRDMDEEMARLERSVDPAPEIADLDAVAAIVDYYCTTLDLTRHYRNRLYAIVELISFGWTEDELTRKFSRTKLGVLPPITALIAEYREVRGLDPDTRSEVTPAPIGEPPGN